MATCHTISPLDSPQDTFSPVLTPDKTRDPKHVLAAAMFKASLELARSQVTLDKEGWRCASCGATCAKLHRLTHAPDCAVERVTEAWDAIKRLISEQSFTA
ncbi:hypothetical protein ACPOL_3421 [Acidisarcina polymorpha]|uniref:Uncharacterized protein n=1 Tax=Acidisarcina polymorpha TaxID=2211140 RepID=A0A2Z5G0Q2_9BACT|nr:hypothetical protein [Acidisarcina polymorpha]AXC12708.1 hypothetical protein ACPOL_3421 [Acidisarcina polymorpha]